MKMLKGALQCSKALYNDVRNTWKRRKSKLCRTCFMAVPKCITAIINLCYRNKFNFITWRKQELKLCKILRTSLGKNLLVLNLKKSVYLRKNTAKKYQTNIQIMIKRQQISIAMCHKATPYSSRYCGLGNSWSNMRKINLYRSSQKALIM